MTAIVINGNDIAAAVRREWKGRAEALKRRGILPALAVIIVGDNLASKIYVRNKVKACCEVGLHSEVLERQAFGLDEDRPHGSQPMTVVWEGMPAPAYD